MTTLMRASMGYDENGNNSELLCPKDATVLEDSSWVRAGDIECLLCHCPYSVHPPVQGALWLRRTCIGVLVKL